MTREPTPPASHEVVISLRLHTEAATETPDARQELVLAALAAALIDASSDVSCAWTVQASPDDPLRYSVRPLAEPPLPAAEVRAIAAQLRAQAAIAAVAPIVEPTP